MTQCTRYSRAPPPGAPSMAWFARVVLLIIRESVLT